MQNDRKYYLLLIIFIAFLLLFGCGGGNDEYPAYKLTISCQGAGSVIKDPNQATYKKGTSVILTAQPANGWHFDQWKKDLTGKQNPVTIVMEKNMDIVAAFVENQPPVLDPIGDKTTYQYQELSFQVTASDPNEDELTYIAISDDGLSTYFDPITHTFSWKPGFATEGEYTITFNVTDGDLSDSETITITVNYANGYPEFTLENQEVNEGETLIFLVNAIDPDGDPIIYSASGELAQHFNPETRYFSWTPTAADIGTHSLTITVTDDKDAATSKTIDVVVLDVNHPPIFELTDKTIAEMEQLYFEVIATDADGDILTYSASGDLVAYFDPDTHIFDWTPGYSNSGNYSLNISVSDGVNTTEKTITVHVTNVNRTPVLALEDQLVEETTTLSLEIIATDPDNDPLTYSASGDLTSFFDPLTQIFEWTPDRGMAGNIFYITFTVSDGELTTQDTIKIEVGINIPDPNFEAVIREKIGKSTGMIVPADVVTIRTIDAQGRNISNLVGIGYMPDLNFLNLNNNSISDIDPLIDLENLQYLFIGGCKIKCVNSKMCYNKNNIQ